MNTEDKDKNLIHKLRSISFQEFADRWLDRLDPELDLLGEIWIEVYRDEIYNEILALQQKCEAGYRLLQHLPSKEAYEAVALSLIPNEIPLPAYETLLPYLRLIGANDNDNFLKIVSLLYYAQRSKKIEKSNLKTN